MRIRAERDTDVVAISSVNETAFETAAESDLVKALRAQASPLVSLVAEDGGKIIGHIMFSPVKLAEYPRLKLMGLAPMAVAPEHQRRGVGGALVRAGLDVCRKLGVDAVVVLGHPQYYPRFGFTQADRFGIECEYDAPAEAFMAIELKPGVLREVSGVVEFHTAFSDL